MGSGVVGFNCGADRVLFGDVNPYFLAVYRGIQSGEITGEIVWKFLTEEGGRLRGGADAYFREVRSRFNREKSLLDFLFLNWACFNCLIRFNDAGDFVGTYGQSAEVFTEARVQNISLRVSELANLFREKEYDFRLQGFEETISCAGEGDFIYCDPPYSGRSTRYFTDWDIQQDADLRKRLDAAGCPYMVSSWSTDGHGKRNELLDTVWGGLAVLEIPISYNVNPSSRVSASEAFICSFLKEGVMDYLSACSKGVEVG